MPASSKPSLNKKKRKKSSPKKFSKLFFMVLGFFLVLLIFSVFFAFRQNENNDQLFSDIKLAFEKVKASNNAEVLEKDDLSVWWIASDNLNIINDNADGIELDLNTCLTDTESRPLFQETALKLGKEVNTVMQKNGFQENSQNSSTSIADTRFYDYIQAYEKGSLKCTYVANPDCASLIGEKQMHYAFSFSCTDKFKENYAEQSPYLKDLKIKDAVIHVDKRVGDFVKLNVNYRRSGYYTIAKLINGKWQELYSGQDMPLCKAVEKYQIPKEILPECYTVNP